MIADGKMDVQLDVSKASRVSRLEVIADSGRVFRLEAGHRSDLKPVTIPK